MECFYFLFQIKARNKVQAEQQRKFKVSIIMSQIVNDYWVYCVYLWRNDSVYHSWGNVNFTFRRTAWCQFVLRFIIATDVWLFLDWTGLFICGFCGLRASSMPWIFSVAFRLWRFLKLFAPELPVTARVDPSLFYRFWCQQFSRS